MFVVTTDDDGKFSYYAGYGWEKAKEIVTRQQWQSYIEQFKKENEAPVVVTVK